MRSLANRASRRCRACQSGPSPASGSVSKALLPEWQGAPRQAHKAFVKSVVFSPQGIFTTMAPHGNKRSPRESLETRCSGWQGLVTRSGS